MKNPGAWILIAGSVLLLVDLGTYYSYIMSYFTTLGKALLVAAYGLIIAGLILIMKE